MEKPPSPTVRLTLVTHSTVRSHHNNAASNYISSVFGIIFCKRSLWDIAFAQTNTCHVDQAESALLNDQTYHRFTTLHRRSTFETRSPSQRCA